MGKKRFGKELPLSWHSDHSMLKRGIFRTTIVTIFCVTLLFFGLSNARHTTNAAIIYVYLIVEL
jgi:hypothetical protein